MKQSDYSYSSLPSDVALKIASSLEAADLSSLGCCSRVWRELCRSDCLWESLVRERWPHLNGEAFLKDPTFKGWRGFYIKRHKEIQSWAASVVEFVEQGSLPDQSLEVTDHLKGIEFLKSKQFGFKDVQLFLFKPELSVLLNLVGLHYCLTCLQLPALHVVEALQSSKISDRQLCIKWWKLGRWFYGFRMRDESHSRFVSLEDLATDKENELLGVLSRGAIHEVLRVQISFANSTSSNLWSS